LDHRPGKLFAPKYISPADRFKPLAHRQAATASAKSRRALTVNFALSYSCRREIDPFREGVGFMSKQATEASERDLEQLTGLFRLLSDKTRLNILMIL